MTRRGGTTQLAWGGRRQRGLYERQGPGLGRPILLGAILLAVAVFIFFVIGRMCGGDDCIDEYCATSRDLASPEGYTRVSKIYELNEETTLPGVPAGNDVQVSLPLTEKTDDGRNLAFYRYVEETDSWEPAGAATLDARGDLVTGVLKDKPRVVAVLRRDSPAGHVIAYLEHNARLHPQAAGRVTIVHTNDFKPGTDGGITGELSSVRPPEGVAFYPSIIASAEVKGDLATVNTLLATPASRTNHVQQIVRLVNQNQLAGIDIAYMDLAADKRTLFTLFVAELAQALHSQGKVLTLTLPPPIVTADRVDEGAYDWAELGKEADILKLAPYRDQGTYRLAMPAILEELTKKVPPEKLVLTITPYASEKSTDGVRRLLITDAMNIATKLRLSAPDGRLATSSQVDVIGVNIDASEGATGMVWQKESATVAFTYKQNGGRTVWIENFFSIGFKLEFITRYKLGGVAIEDASDNPFLGDIWPALVPFIASGQPVLMAPNENDLLPTWRVSDGTAEQGKKGILKWTTPAQPGTYTVYLTLSDGVALFENAISVVVQERERANASPTPAR